MVNQASNIQILFDLMNGLLGPKTEDIILKKNMPIFVKKLNCFMACVVKFENEKPNVKYLLPLVLQKNEKWLQILMSFFEERKEITFIEKKDNKCFEYHFDNDYYYKFIIEDYGCLVLGKKKPFEKFFKFELIPVINFFGKSLLLAVERKKLEDSEKQIYREKQLLRTIIDNIPIHVYAKDLNDKRILSNKTEIDYFGLDTEENVVGKTHNELFTNIKISNEIKRDLFIFEGNKIINQEVIHSKNNKKSWFLHSKIPLKNEKDDIVGLVGIALNITEQKKVEEKLLSSNRQLKIQEEKYRHIISNMNLGLLEIDLDGTIQFCNHGFEKTLGYTFDEIVGKKAQEILRSEEFAGLIDKKIDQRQSGISDSYEILIKDKKGKSKWLLISGAPNYDDYGEIIGSIGVQLDITKQKELESDLEKTLSQSQKNSEAKELFLANMSHEIRTPLNGIIGMIRELSKESMSGKQEEYLNRAMVASRHLHSVVNSILEITKIEAGEFIINQHHFDLPELLEDIISILKPQSEQKNIDLELKINGFTSTVFIGDEARIRQILINIAGNSIKFTEKGKVSITCDVESKSSAHNKLCFTITDTGIGMEKEFLKVLFKKFQQEDASISRKFGGTGLGMFISKQLVGLMGGDIEVKSEKGYGSEFKVYIPLRIGDVSKVEKRQFNHDNVDGVLENAKILLVEDNELNRLVASNTLSIWNVNLVEVENGIEAIEVLKKEAFDIILMDLQMPVMNGMEATKIIRNELNIQTPIIALSANAFKSEIDSSLSIGMNDFITKPFEEEDLYKVLVKHINKSKKNGLTPASTLIQTPIFTEKEIVNKNYNLDKLQKMSRGNRAFVQKMLRLFVNTIPEAINSMNRMLSEDDIDGVKKIAHKIKPSLNNMGVAILGEDIIEIEKFNQEEKSIDLLTELVNHVTLILNEVIVKIQDVELID